MYTREQLIVDVTIEANKIMQYATTKEIENLNIQDLKATDRKRCPYGQMTGDCFSLRAAQLIEQCTPRYFTSGILPWFANDTIDMRLISECVNGTEVDLFITERVNQEYVHFSAIEAYILLRDAKNENLIAYIKGTTNTLDL